MYLTFFLLKLHQSWSTVETTTIKNFNHKHIFIFSVMQLNIICDAINYDHIKLCYGPISILFLLRRFTSETKFREWFLCFVITKLTLLSPTINIICYCQILFITLWCIKSKQIEITTICSIIGIKSKRIEISRNR